MTYIEVSSRKCSQNISIEFKEGEIVMTLTHAKSGRTFTRLNRPTLYISSIEEDVLGKGKVQEAVITPFNFAIEPIEGMDFPSDNNTQMGVGGFIYQEKKIDHKITVSLNKGDEYLFFKIMSNNAATSTGIKQIRDNSLWIYMEII